MRFAYIDSHGNEVPIPSVDALALRIELGAIGPETQLYDAQADQWGPASTHEIFHTLARDAKEDAGFVAPPPPVAPLPPPPAPAAPAPPKPKAAPPPKPKQQSIAPPATSAMDLGLTLADPPPEPPKKKSEPEPAVPSLDLSLDLAPPMDLQPPARTTDPGASSDGPGLGGTFDYGDLGMGLQLEDSGLEAPPGDHGGAMAIDDPMQFGVGGGGGGDLQLEEPMSAFQPDSPPGWMAEPGGGGVMDFSARAESAGAEAAPLPPIAETPARQRREPKARPSAPKFKQQRNLAGPLILVVLLLALGVGGYVGWPLLQARLNQPEAPVRPAVVMPALPAELVPQMRSLAEGAIADAIAEVDAATTTAETPVEPHPQWLAGTYLADAGQYASVEAFWTGIGSFIRGVRGGEWRLYHDKLVARASAEGIAAETAAMIVERADSGFVAAGDAREQAYATMERLVEASLALHEFLVANEANIEYRPATTSTADPILEAVPNNTAIGDQMLEMVDRITGALADLGSLDRVTRERLTSALTTRLQQVGVQ